MKTRGGPPGSLNFRLLRMTELSYTLSAELLSTTDLLTTRGVQNSRVLMNSRLLLIVKSYWTHVYQTTELSSTSSTELSSTNLLNFRLPNRMYDYKPDVSEYIFLGKTNEIPRWTRVRISHLPNELSSTRGQNSRLPKTEILGGTELSSTHDFQTTVWFG